MIQITNIRTGIFKCGICKHCNDTGVYIEINKEGEIFICEGCFLSAKNININS